ncbi:MAG: ATP-binding protein [Candidatus Omnitrophota bacterium]
MFIEPVFGKKLFGREEVMGTLQKRVTDLKGGYRQNLALTGPMLAGKSSILRSFLKNIKDTDVIPLYIEMDGADLRFFCTQFMAALMYHYLRSLGKKAENDFDALRKDAAGLIPVTVESIDKVSELLNSKKNDAAYERLLDLTSVFKKETGKNCLVILDEFHNLSNFKLRKPFQIFGKFIMVQKNTMYIVSSSQRSLLKEILTRRLSLLFGNFEVIEINGFDSRTARSFVSEKLRSPVVSPMIKDYLIQITQGNPFYLENLASRTSELMEKDNTGEQGDKECLLSALSELLYESNGVLNQYFTNNMNFFLERKNRRKFIPVLTALACGRRTLSAIQGHSGKVDKEMGQILQKLQDMDLILNSGVFYCIEDKLFEYWLKYVYDLKGRSLINDMGIKYLEFKKALAEDYERHCAFMEKDPVDVVSDLFRDFNGEKIRISMNMRKMPRFEHVDAAKVSETVSRVTGRIGGRIWISDIKMNDITDEKDICDLWEIKTCGSDSKVMRKIFVPLKGIEQNAYLLAKEHGIWVWDQKQLNNVLRLFGKFEMIK